MARRTRVVLPAPSPRAIRVLKVVVMAALAGPARSSHGPGFAHKEDISGAVGAGRSASEPAES